MQGNCLGYHCLGRNYKGEMIRPAITGGPFIQRFIFLMTNVRVQLYFEAKSASDCTGGNYPGGNDRGAQLCGGHLFRAQLSWGQLSWGGQLSWEQLSGWQLSRRNLPRGNCPCLSMYDLLVDKKH